MSSASNQSEDQPPILSRDSLEESDNRREVIVKVEGESDDVQMKNGNPFGTTAGLNNSKVWRDQKIAGAEMALDTDLEMEELKKPTTSSTSLSSKEQRVSFHDVSNDQPSRNLHVESDDDDFSDDCVEGPELRRTSAAASPHSMEGANVTEVLRCTSNSSFYRSRPLPRARTRSRLMDPPPCTAAGERKSMRMPNRSGQIPQRSSLLGKSRVIEEDEDDPFEDLPEESTRASRWTTLELIGLVLALAALICSLVIRKLARHTVWELHLWKWEVLVLVLISGRLLSGWFIRIIVFFFQRNFFLRKRFLYFVYGVRRAVQNCIWLGLVLLSWHFLFDKKVVEENKMLSYITKILFCLIIATVLRLIKTLLIKFLASSFHVTTYFDRIQEALFNQYVIETLSGPPLLEIQHNMEKEDRMMAEVEKLQNAGATIPKELRAAVMSLKYGRVIGGSGVIGHGGTGLKSSQIGKNTKFSGSVSRKDFNRQQLQQEEWITIDQLHKLNQNNISA